ncbi:MucBP domain-containing protein, partial [Lactobacillus sp. AN1001]
MQQLIPEKTNQTTHYVDQNGNDIAPSITLTGITGQTYMIPGPKEITGYKLISSPKNITGIFSNFIPGFKFSRKQANGHIELNYTQIDSKGTMSVQILFNGKPYTGNVSYPDGSIKPYTGSVIVPYSGSYQQNFSQYPTIETTYLESDGYEYTTHTALINYFIDSGQDVKYVYTPIINDKTVSTSQTIHYEGAGDSTPADNIQNNFTFEGKENAATGVTTWNETSHTYNTVNSPVVEGYYTDQASVAGQTVTPDDPNKTITVTYHKLGNIVPTDPAGNPIPGHPAVPYTNDPDNPSQVTPNEPVPDIPGYTPDKSTVTPNDPGQDTPVVYTPIINDKTVSTSQTIHYEGAGDSTPADNIQNNFTFED